MAKLLIATSSSGTSVRPKALSSECLSSFASSVEVLSLAQCVDLWKTFLYHAATAKEADDDQKSVLSLLEDLLPCFVRNVPILDFTVPRSSRLKFASLLSDTFSIASSSSSSPTTLPKTLAAASELSRALKHYRGEETSEALCEEAKEGQLQGAIFR